MDIHISVTNDLSYDQRMIRICRSLAAAGHQVCLVGRLQPDSMALAEEPFQQLRLPGWFSKGPLFYAEYNLRLLIQLLTCKTDIYWAVDLDTILPVYLASIIRRRKRFFDAHELFCEMKELSGRPATKSIWQLIERLMLPRFPHGITVSESISRFYLDKYGVHYQVIRNIPCASHTSIAAEPEGFILYQGAVNEGRCFEQLIPAMKHVPLPLHIYGKGNFFQQAKLLIAKHGLEDHVFLKGSLPPGKLKELTPKANIGISLFQDGVLHNRFSLANRFFDFMHAGVPQICSNYPEYRAIVNRFQVAVLVDNHSPEEIAAAMNKILENQLIYASMKDACKAAASVFQWQNEEKVLRAIIEKIQ